ncbi:MAG: hypothetical protein ACRD3Y_11025, partial [Bryobacteraceae bacterium]
MNAPKLTGNRCQCPTCGEYLSSPRAFDRHRTGDYAKAGKPNTRRCIPVADLLANGWVRNARGFLMQPDPRRAGEGFPAHRAPEA